jgi:membrane-bound metal-dependent hydrolase YbcI (DUF457 family)
VFIGHLAAGLALKARVRTAPLAALLAGSAFADVVHGLLELAGIERAIVRDPPVFANWELVEIGYSHSLVVSLFYSVVIGALGARWWRSRAIGTALALAVFSHFILDVLSHKADVPLIGLGLVHDLKLGTGLAVHPLPFFLVELGWCLVAWYLYDPANRRLLLTLFVLMAVWANSVFGFALPPPPPPAAQGLLTIVPFAVAGWALWWASRPATGQAAPWPPRGGGCLRRWR